MTTNVKPKLTVLSADNIQQVHETALTILEKTGIRVDDPNARRVFAKAVGGKMDRDRIFIPGEMVEWAIEAAPSRLELYSRNGKPGFRLDSSGTEQTVFGIGVTNLYYQDPATDAVTAFTRKHMELATRLGSVLSGFDVISTVGIIQDIAPELADLYGTLEMIANTTKPLVILISEKQCFDTALDLLEHLHGDLSAKPFIIPYFNPITPLVLNEDTADKIFSTIERDLPFIRASRRLSYAA